MVVTGKIAQIRKHRWADPEVSWGLVPTMGFLHDGHMSLVRKARAENERVAVSIFVNPSQFSPDEDLSSYPRDLDSDLSMLRQEGVDLVFTPDSAEMYPAGYQTAVLLKDITKPLEGAARPTHFLGVATVVAKLFNIVQPTRAYFGQKDAQQVAVLRRMVADLNINTDIRVCPIMREPDGLAMSSRNSYLNADERKAARVLYRAINAAHKALEMGETDGDNIRLLMRKVIVNEPLARIDYVSAANPETLREATLIDESVLLSMAVFIGKTRLIDNMVWHRKLKPTPHR